jgi:hypothetical protein
MSPLNASKLLTSTVFSPLSDSKEPKKKIDLGNSHLNPMAWALFLCEKTVPSPI